MAPDPTLDDPNPYRSPTNSPATEKVSPPSHPAALIVLTLLAAVHVLVSLALLGVGLLAGHAPTLGGALVCFGFYVAILFGLILRQEWARIMLIWLSYVGIVSYLIQTAYSPWVAPVTLVLLALEVTTLILAHSRSVRETTKGASLAKAYTYHESPQMEKEDA